MIGLETSSETPPDIINSGVLIDGEHVLTSYNPFRKLKDKTNDMIIAILTGRQFNRTISEHDRRIQYYKIVCTGQVVPIPESLITAEQWHGEEKLHSPLHDLFVMRISENLTLLDPEPSKYSFSYISYSKFTDIGPVITHIANKTDLMGDNIKFASLGYKNNEQSVTYDMLNSKTFESKNSIVDCDEWMIRDWGHFICVLNEDGFLGIGSGAVLVENHKLYGIGSFSLKKGNLSILVFTDVRPYHPYIFNTCVDVEKEIHDNTTTTTESYDYN
jgi:hypothetical protein